MRYIIKLNLTIVFLAIFNMTFAQQQARPQLRWVMPVGQSAEDMAVDKYGQTYAIGSLTNNFIADYPIANQVYQPLSRDDIYIAKHDALGNLLWFNQIKIIGYGWGGGWNMSWLNYIERILGLHIGIDQVGHVFITGTIIGTADFNPGQGIDTISNGFFIAKYTNNGQLIWVKRFDNHSNMTTSIISTYLLLDKSGNVYIRGTFGGTLDFDPGPGVVNRTACPNSRDSAGNPFLLKLDNDGRFQWVNTFDGAFESFEQGGAGAFYGGEAISKDPEGTGQYILVSGRFTSTRNNSHEVDFDPNPNNHLYLNTDSGHYFLAKYRLNGSPVWAYNFGDTLGLNPDSNQFITLKVAIDDSDHIFLTGSYRSDQPLNINPKPGHRHYLPKTSSYQIPLLQGYPPSIMFMAKLTSEANVIWSHFFPPKAMQRSSAFNFDVATDKEGSVYITGYAKPNTIDFTPSFNTTLTLSPYEVGPFVLKLDARGRIDFLASVRPTTTRPTYPQRGTSTYNDAFKTSVDSFGNIYIVGLQSRAADFDPGAGTSIFNPLNYSLGTSVGFVWKLSQNCSPVVDSVSVSACNNYTLGGRFFDSSGTYAVVLSRIHGSCDSIVVLDLSIGSAITTVSRHGDTLISDDTNATTYRWLRCNGLGNYTPISGAVNRSYLPTSNGRYAVVIFNTDCADTSNCIRISGLGIKAMDIGTDLQIIPNPTQNQVRIRFGETVHHVGLKLTDALGKVVWKADDFSGKTTSINLRKLATGVYYLRVKTDAGMRVKKVVKW